MKEIEYFVNTCENTSIRINYIKKRRQHNSHCRLYECREKSVDQIMEEKQFCYGMDKKFLIDVNVEQVVNKQKLTFDNATNITGIKEKLTYITIKRIWNY